MTKTFKCTCGLKACNAMMGTQKEAAQMGAAHILADRTFKIWQKENNIDITNMAHCIVSLGVAKEIGERCAIVAGLIADHLDILEESIAHYCYYADKKEKV